MTWLYSGWTMVVAWCGSHHTLLDIYKPTLDQCSKWNGEVTGRTLTCAQ